MGDEKKHDPRRTVRGFAQPSVSDEIEPQPSAELPVEERAAERKKAPDGTRGAPAQSAIPIPPKSSPPISAPKVHAAAGPRGPRRPAVEVELVHERRAGPVLDRKWVAVEVWTQNRIYALDAQLRCIDVVDQATGKSEPKHPMRGALLVGGQHREGEEMELSHPFPRPGSEAVFESGSGPKSTFSQTSTVTRVVLRLRVVTVARDHIVPAWEDITGLFHASPLGEK